MGHGHVPAATPEGNKKEGTRDMKKYIKPTIEVMKVEVESALLAASGLEEVPVIPGDTNEADRSKRHSFSVWGEEEE